MITKIARLRLRIDRAKVAALFGVAEDVLITLPLSSVPHSFLIRYWCTHRREPLSPQDLTLAPDPWVELHLLVDEDGTCYGMAGVCYCRRIYFVEPTIDLLDFIGSLAKETLSFK